jgi:hypothetical protein
VTTNTLRGLVAVGVLAAFGAAPGAADSPAFGIGVLRRDSIIIPFAAFDGKRWTSNWPAPEADLTVPISLRDVPSRWWGATGPLERWQVFTDGESQAVRVVQPDWAEVHCDRQIGLRTDYAASAPVPPRTEQPYPKDGLAVSPAQLVMPIAVVPLASADARLLTPALLGAFNAAERELEHKSGGHPVSRRAREGRAPDLEAVYAVGEHPRLYYVEASRRYRELGQRVDECAAVAFGTGWFTRDGDRVKALDVRVDLLDCDRAYASYMLPLGVINAAGRLFWIAQFSGWDHERYVVIEIKPKSVDAVLSTWGGSCSK